MKNIKIENASWQSEVEVLRLWHIAAYTPDGDYVDGSEFSDNDPNVVVDWFTHEYAEELGNLESLTFEVEHVGYTVYDFGDDVVDIYL